MSTIPAPLHAVTSAIYRWWESEGAKETPRAHLGASQIGHACARHLWYSFRWCSKQSWDGRMLRLFHRGQKEEATFISELRGIGAEVLEFQPDGNQWRIEALGGHFGCSLDGICRNLPGGSKTNWEVLEFKTHNARSFKDLNERGVEKSKPAHYIQMQVGMGMTGMTRANYLAVCKDDDHLYYERVEFDGKAFKSAMERAQKIIFAPEPVHGISTNPAWYQCKGCQNFGLCHEKRVPVPSCRTCIHATPTQDGDWLCERHSKILSVPEQIAACDGHRFIPALLANLAEYLDGNSVENWVKYKNEETGCHFVNGSGEDEYTSAELHSAADSRAIGDVEINRFKAIGARIVG